MIVGSNSGPRFDCDGAWGCGGWRAPDLDLDLDLGSSLEGDIGRDFDLDRDRDLDLDLDLEPARDISRDPILEPARVGGAEVLKAMVSPVSMEIWGSGIWMSSYNKHLLVYFVSEVCI